MNETNLREIYLAAIQQIEELADKLEDAPLDPLDMVIAHCRRQALYAQFDHDTTRVEVYDELIDWLNHKGLRASMGADKK